MNDEINRTQLLDLLSRLIRKKETGTIYLRTDENHLIVIGIDGGDVASLICGPRQGERAIPMIRDMRSGTYRLEDDVTHHRRFGANLPSGEALLSLLSDEPEEEYDDAPTEEALKMSSRRYPRDTRAGETNPGNSGGRTQAILCKVLAEYLGPIAPLVCRDAISAVGGIDSGDKLKRVIESLAGEIEETNEADRFRLQAKNELGNLLA